MGGEVLPADAPAWRKSSHSFSNGNCVEVAWHKAKASAGADCVEAASCGHGVLVRDSKDPDGPRLRFTEGEWAAFVAAVKDGEFG